MLSHSVHAQFRLSVHGPMGLPGIRSPFLRFGITDSLWLRVAGADLRHLRNVQLYDAFMGSITPRTFREHLRISLLIHSHGWRLLALPSIATRERSYDSLQLSLFV
jgi:hypothetical protein